MACLSGPVSTLAVVPVLLCDLANVVFDVSFAGPILRWREANGGFLGVHEPRDLADSALRAFEVGQVGEPEYACHLRAQLLWQGGDPELVEIFGDAFGPVDLDVLQVLDDLRREGWRLVGVMNTNPWHERVWRERYGEALRVFDGVVTSTGLGLRIPDPRFYGAALRQVPPEGYRLVVGDRPKIVSAARAAGLDAHLFRGAAGMAAACQSLATPAL
jgi:FMN phosphatase YigB (HAD superfamily)